MKNKLNLITMIAVVTVGFQAASAQFPIKIPKINIEKPKTETTTSTDPTPAASPTPQPSGTLEYMYRPEPTGVPQFLLETLEIKIQGDSRYWKIPGLDNYSSWIPQVSFGLFFNNSVRMRYSAEWSNPDGSLWFSEPLDIGSGGGVSSTYSGELFATKAAVSTGTYGLKIINTKNGQAVFQGKFKVNKIPLSPGDPKLKNQNLFYVDNDWLLPIGYAGFESAGLTSWMYPNPNVYFWFKGGLSATDFEARLFYNNQEIASSDNGGVINTVQKRGDSCFAKVELCQYSLWVFNWNHFMVENHETVRKDKPNVMFTRDRPGEYTAKIFYGGAQVRETKFAIDAQGWIARNAVSDQIFLTYYKVAVPVKVMGTLDKWNSATAKTDAFYGNPPTGLAVP
jgi:hypothetical protein